MTLRRLLLAALVAGVALGAATTASARHGSGSIRLRLVPLEKAELGSAGASLPLAYGSGPEDNSLVIFGGPGGGQLSPVGGYVLDYGDPFTGSTGVMEIRSSVEEYKSSADADKAIRFEQLFAGGGGLFGSPLVSTTTKKVKAENVGRRRFAFLTTYVAPNLNPIVRLDEQVATGKYILDLTVTAGSPAAAEHIAPHLVRLLHHRLLRLLWGHSVESASVKLPPDPQPGQAPGGPDLSTLILQPTDVGQSHAVNLIQAYAAGPPALSDYVMFLQPAGTYDELQQQIAWWPTATEATYGETYAGVLSEGFFGFLLAVGQSGGTPVDLSSVGDGAVGYLDTEPDVGSAAYITLTNGQAGETIVAISHSPLTDADVVNLAQAAADRLNAGLP